MNGLGEAPGDGWWTAISIDKLARQEDFMQWSSTQRIVDYTTVPSGLRIEGQIWTGQATTFTALCAKCGRIGVMSAMQHNKRIMVHQGRATGNRLEGIDYCELLISTEPNTAP